ncbi:hypothetical protein E2562_027458 [Oryza meyeriana var. granulata]|uniref:Uncharacterized protein n=1 Tax=Oryza meyeriana var. granulata TaxID=110450 RepID=A0A6G1CIY9_9ORYZ|nr:hypothetical protein E2562_027458 [Oryza meyeriana var. granulata]
MGRRWRVGLEAPRQLMHALGHPTVEVGEGTSALAIIGEEALGDRGTAAPPLHPPHTVQQPASWLRLAGSIGGEAKVARFGVPGLLDVRCGGNGAVLMREEGKALVEVGYSAVLVRGEGEALVEGSGSAALVRGVDKELVDGRRWSGRQGKAQLVEREG